MVDKASSLQLCEPRRGIPRITRGTHEQRKTPGRCARKVCHDTGPRSHAHERTQNTKTHENGVDARGGPQIYKIPIYKIINWIYRMFFWRSPANLIEKRGHGVCVVLVSLRVLRAFVRVGPRSLVVRLRLFGVSGVFLCS